MTTVVLSSIPSSVIQKVIGKKSVRRWIYLGASDEVLTGLAKILPSDGRVDYARELYDISEQYRRDFVAWVDQISLSGSVCREWFFSVPATKNPYSSQLFLNVCYFFVFKQIAARHKDIDLVIVDSSALSQVLISNFNNVRSSSANILGNLILTVQGWTKSVGRIFLFVGRSSRMLWAARWTLGGRADALLNDPTPRTLIRNYITKDYSDSDSGMFESHFFPNLSAYLEQHGKKPIFLPIAINIVSFKDLFQRVKKGKLDVIFAEEFLKIKDYIYAVFAPIRGMFYGIASVDIHNHDLRRLVVEDYQLNLSDLGVLNGILLSRLGQRLKARGLVLETIINWSEFQSFEKGLVAGLREAYPEAKLIGSQPFCPPQNHLCLRPSRQDHLYKIVPDKLLVLGPVTEKAVKEFLPDLSLGFTPAFRYQSIFNFRSNPSNAKDLIVLFGYGLANSLFVLKTLIELKDQMPAFQKIFIKMHPATYFTKERLIREVGAVIPQNIIFVEGPLEQYLDSVMMGICGATGTAVELVARGIPVVVVAEERVLTMHYLPSRSHQDLWRLCFSQDEIMQSVKNFYEQKIIVPQKFAQSAIEFQKTYFAEPDDRHWENYLTDETKKYDYAV